LPFAHLPFKKVGPEFKEDFWSSGAEENQTAWFHLRAKSYVGPDESGARRSQFLYPLAYGLKSACSGSRRRRTGVLTARVERTAAETHPSGRPGNSFSGLISSQEFIRIYPNCNGSVRLNVRETMVKAAVRSLACLPLFWAHLWAQGLDSHGENAQGAPIHVEFTAKYDGQDNPVTGSPDFNP
jgi:hypothetical protein